MELALYCPIYGYYEKQQDNIGRGGDYYTSVSVGPLFGELLAFQFAEWAEGREGRGARGEGRESCRVQIVEAGAHGGELARDILNWFQRNRPDRWPGLQYFILEPSLVRRQWQQEKLHEFSQKIQWFTDWRVTQPLHPIHAAPAERAIANELTTLPPLPFGRGEGRLAAPKSDGGGGEGAPYRIIFSNELLDSFPVHRLGWDAKKPSWFEWGVRLQNDKFVWVQLREEYQSLQRSNAATLQRCNASTPKELHPVIPDGYTTEICPAATEWWQQAANALDFGKLLTIDYGLTADELLAPHRTAGTLRAYRRHKAGADLLADPGEQDLTAHVNFTALQEAGEAAGLETESFVTQPQFLTSIASRLWSKTNPPITWTANQKRQFQTLTHTEHLGRSFRVLVQSRHQAGHKP